MTLTTNPLDPRQGSLAFPTKTPMMAVMDIAENAFLIVISGVFIFTIQRIISDLWISPNVNFQKALAKIEVLLQRSQDISAFTEGKNETVTSSTGRSVDTEILMLRSAINQATWELLSTYNSLYFAEKWWLKLLGTNVHNAKPPLLMLSVLLCKPGDWDTGDSKAKQKIREIYSTLNIKYVEINKRYFANLEATKNHS